MINRDEIFADPYEAIIVGSGAGGGVAANVLAQAGKRVLILERGRDLKWQDVGRDHLRNHRYAIYGHNTGPDPIGSPRVFIDAQGNRHLPAPHEWAYHNNAMAVGGGTLVYGAQAWRFMPQDFRMTSLYGVPQNSGLADWPISYEDLEPHYERAEWEIGVAGSGGAMTLHGPRRRDYPMPAVPDNPQRTLLQEAAQKQGWQTCPVPFAINTVPFNNRPACVQCGACVGFACPSDGKNGTQNTVLPRALATGNATLLSEAIVDRIETDANGNVIGVGVYTADNIRRIARSKIVILAAGAIETARLLLNSKTDGEPQGIGNNHDLVGRYLQGHGYPGAFGLFDQVVHTNAGPGPSIATCQFNHGNPGIIGGGMLANEFVKLPILFWRQAFPPGVKRWGAEAKNFMRYAYRRVVHLQGPIQEIPSPTSRVTIDPQVRDQWNIPVARLSGDVHPESIRVAQFMRQRAVDWLTAANAKQIWSFPPGTALSAGQHQAGTARMATDPKKGVTNKNGQVFGHENLFVADASLHVTNGGFNPVLTIMALAYRVAEAAVAVL